MNRVEGVIWDLDNTLYRFNEDFIHACNLASARAAIALGVPLRLGDALALAEESYAFNSFSGHFFIERHGIRRADYHAAFHDQLDEKVLRKSEETRACFATSRLAHVLVTHASRSWALRTLEHLGLRDYFPDERIVALEDAGYEQKCSSRRPFDLALAQLSLPAEKAVVVEDTLRNLRVPHEMGLATILVHHGRVPVDIPGFVRSCCASAQDVFGLLEAGPDQVFA